MTADVREQPHSIRAEQRVLDALMAARDPDLVDEVAAALDRAAFYREQHAVLFDAILALRKEGAPTSADAVADYFVARGDTATLARIGGGPYLATLMELDTPPQQATYWAGVVARHARVREAQVEAARYSQAVESGDLDRITAEQHRLIDSWVDSQPATTAATPRGGAELDAFLAQDEPEHQWLIPGVLERGDRVILTGGEGHGKSTLLRQLGVQAASGIHPFGGTNHEPLRVWRLDLENGAHVERRELRPLRLAAGNRYGGGMWIDSRVEGLDLLRGEDAAWLLDLAAQRQPDVLITGPAYKMHAGDPTEEGAARTVAAYLDRLRVLYGCVILLEAHSPHASNGKRPTRPYGASLWLRWPEFGLHLGQDGALTHWRGARDQRDWPPILERGGPWPWTPVTRGRDILWARIRALCVDVGDQVSERDLAELTGASKSTVHRVIAEHQAEWDTLAGDQP